MSLKTEFLISLDNRLHRYPRVEGKGPGEGLAMSCQDLTATGNSLLLRTWVPSIVRSLTALYVG